MRKLLVLAVLATLLLPLTSCSHEEARPAEEAVDTLPMLITRVRECSRLYTTECQIHKIVTHSDKMNVSGQFLQDKIDIDLPFGERRVAIPMDATVKAYIDFSDFSEANVRRDGRKITVILPDPQIVITATRINHSEVRQHVPWLRSDFSDAELTAYEKQGRDAIVATLPQLGLTEKARLSAAHTLIPLISSLGYSEEDITVSFRKTFAPADYPSLLKTNG